jgi:hypothetical protein
MTRTTTVAKHQLKPTVHIDAVPELARQRERFYEGERARKQTAAGEAVTSHLDGESPGSST